MDNYLVSVSLILSFSLTVIGDTSVCHSNADGHYEIGCRSYVICTGGRGVIHNCPDPPAQETVYNSAKGHCDK
uniref:Chitin-binding type-2 domain-containing protein n=1 Tax=Magallana gigas TaxID=29159 RepID=A0A8W8KZ50_MAGGI